MADAMSTPMPQWLKLRIATNTRKASLTACACGLPVLTGLDDDRCAFPAVVEPLPLTYPGQLGAAYSQARTVYDVIGGALYRRGFHSLTAPSKYTVFAEHRCEQPLPQEWLLTVTVRPERGNDEPPPF